MLHKPFLKKWAIPPLFDPEKSQRVVEPPGQGLGCWAGAPSAIFDDTTQTFFLCYRLRKPPPDRGYLLRIASSKDGIHFETLWETSKETFPTESIERCSLIKVSNSLWRLYVSYVDSEDRRWRIDLLSASSPEAFIPQQRQKVFTAEDIKAEGVKDPVVYYLGGLWVMLASFSPTPPTLNNALRQQLHATGDVFATGLSRSATGLAISEDGEHWQWQGEVFGGHPGGWDAYAGRLSTVLHEPPLFLCFYDGSRSVEQNYEEQTGIALSFDLCHYERVSLSQPALISPYGKGSLRYLEAIPLEGLLYYYYEMSQPDGSHDLRVSIVKTEGGEEWE